MRSSKPISSFQISKEAKKTLLPLSFYLRENVVDVARDLLGKVLVSNIDGSLTAGIISETEAYAGISDRASHAYGNRCTKRTEVMYQTGGRSYVYLCYGIHYLFNVVTNVEEVPHAVLIRNIIPIEGIDTIKKRRGKSALKKLTTGPGTVSQALGINKKQNNISLLGKELWIEDRSIDISEKDIITSARIGVEYAEKDALLPYRFFINS